MASSQTYSRWARSKFRRWLLEGSQKPTEGFYQQEKTQHPTHPWWRVMCLTGVDYFSSLGYQPSIAALAAGVLSPIATLMLVLLTLFGALPMYRRVAGESPHGDGSISMLERLLKGWTGKFVVLVLLGFVATGFVITITLSAADATAHIIENPLWPTSLDLPVPITLVLIGLLGAVFLKGFKEAIGIAVVLVVVYIGLSLVVVITGFVQIAQHPEVFGNWSVSLHSSYTSISQMLLVTLLVFPQLALGLSGFETGVVVMPLVKGDPDDTPDHPKGRIRNSRKLLTGAALIMSVMLLTSAVVTTLLIPAQAFQEGGEANGRALAYLAHTYLGNAFGTAYDLSTITILWFAGASAMAGLLNIVPRYLPRYGMAPDWARATRPLVLIYTAICFAVTLVFRASVDAQAAAYATGVLVLMGSAAVAVTLSALYKRQAGAVFWFGLVSLIFFYTLIVNVLKHPSGLQIASLFILGVVVISVISRIFRSTELRVDRIEVDADAEEIIKNLAQGEIRLIANHRESGNAFEYNAKESDVRARTHMPPKDPVAFLEVTVPDASDFSGVLKVRGVEVGEHRILRMQSPSVPNAIAAVLLYIRDHTGKIPHIYFEWGERSPIQAALQFLILGEGDVPTMTHEVLRQAEPNARRRPLVHVGGY
ncbi:MAG: amino acid transporter [Thermaceae bacterium]|nr:amino acid transporter [Thermaceae bacterium]